MTVPSIRRVSLSSSLSFRMKSLGSIVKFVSVSGSWRYSFFKILVTPKSSLLKSWLLRLMSPGSESKVVGGWPSSDAVIVVCGEDGSDFSVFASGSTRGDPPPVFCLVSSFWGVLGTA